MLREARAGFSIAIKAVTFCQTRRTRCSGVGESGFQQVNNDLTLSSSERRRLAARTAATVGVAREQELTGQSMKDDRREAQDEFKIGSPALSQIVEKAQKIQGIARSGAGAALCAEPPPRTIDRHVAP